MTRLSNFVEAQGHWGPLIFITANCLATLFLVPQVLFTVLAGVLFGWKWGAAYASVGMTVGAVLSFYIARYGAKDWIRGKFATHAIYKAMRRLSQTHPLHVISISRVVPVLPFPVTSYLLGVTEVRSLPYALLTWICMLPETLFLASGGHLLHSGIQGKASEEAAIVLAIAGVLLWVVVHKMKRSLVERAENDQG